MVQVSSLWCRCQACGAGVKLVVQVSSLWCRCQACGAGVKLVVQLDFFPTRLAKSSFRECKARHVVSKPYTNLQNCEVSFPQSGSFCP